MPHPLASYKALRVAFATLLLAAALGCGGAAESPKPAAKREKAGEFDAASILPASAQGAFFLDLREIAKTGAEKAKGLLDEAAASDPAFAKALADSGFDPARDLRRIAAGFWESDGATSTPGYVLAAEAGLDLDKLMAAAQAAAEADGNKREAAFARETIAGVEAWRVEWTRSRRRESHYALREGDWLLGSNSRDRLAAAVENARGGGGGLDRDPIYIETSAKLDPKAALRMLVLREPKDAPAPSFGLKGAEGNWTAEGASLKIFASATDEEQAEMVRTKAQQAAAQAGFFAMAIDPRLAPLGMGWLATRDGVDVVVQSSWNAAQLEQIGAALADAGRKAAARRAAKGDD